MMWLFFPPVFSFFFLILSALLHNKAAAVAVPNVVWGMTVAAYICMCALSLFFIMRGEYRFNYGISFLTQGLMISVMSMQFGVTFMSWIGLIFFLAGLVAAFFYTTRQHMPDSPSAAVVSHDDNAGSSYKKLDGVLEKLAVAVCHTDNKGVVANATTRFCEAVGRDVDDIVGKTITDLIPLDNDEVTLASGTWWITQEHDGARYYFLLKPTPDGKPQEAKVVEIPSDEKSIYDKATGLYTDEYRKIRGPEEVIRAQRYKRPLSGLLVAMSLEPSSDVQLTQEQENMLDSTFKSNVQTALRNTDCGFLTVDGRVQVLLPETPQAGAKTLLSRILTMPQDIFDEDIRMAVNPRVSGGLFFYNGASRMEYGIFSAALEEAFVKNRDGNETTAQKNQAA
ncbi:MAG: PAS domain-containing protein [Synergistaceae bacterium]|jgi:PAS domain-containing protein|nr:PAS domain-containing protein [Synergistaceae bacterium]